jgi:hypothetical protein
LIEAIQPYSPRAKKFLENASRMAPDWETQARFSDPAKEIIAFSFVGVLGTQLRKVMAIGKEEISVNKVNKYLRNCQLASKRALQLLCFALISRLWDHKKDTAYILSPSQTVACKNFFDDEFESDSTGLINLLKTLLEIFTDNNLGLPIAELSQFKESLEPVSAFVQACTALQAFDERLEKNPGTVTDCAVAENALATVLEHLKFLANYKMVSIKSIGYFEMRNSKPHYLYYYTALGIDSKSNVNQERINYAEAPINTDAVLLYKGSYQQNLNLFPFVIDVNALAVEGGAKICFYACYNNADDSLNYSFVEDNSIVNIANTATLKSGTDVNELLLDPKKRRDMKFDTVYALFGEAKKAVTGIDEEEAPENPF